MGGGSSGGCGLFWRGVRVALGVFEVADFLGEAMDKVS